MGCLLLGFALLLKVGGNLLGRFWELAVLVGQVAESGPVSEDGPKLQGEGLLE